METLVQVRRRLSFKEGVGREVWEEAIHSPLRALGFRSRAGKA